MKIANRGTELVLPMDRLFPRFGEKALDIPSWDDGKGMYLVDQYQAASGNRSLKQYALESGNLGDMGEAEVSTEIDLYSPRILPTCPSMPRFAGCFAQAMRLAQRRPKRMVTPLVEALFSDEVSEEVFL